MSRERKNRIVSCDLTDISVLGLTNSDVNTIVEVFKLFKIPYRVGRVMFEIDKDGNRIDV